MMADPDPKGSAGAPDAEIGDPSKGEAVVAFSEETGLLSVDLPARATIEAIVLSAGQRRIATVRPTRVEGDVRRFVFDLRAIPSDLLLAPRVPIRGMRPDAPEETVFALDVESRKLHPLRAVGPATGSIEGHVDGWAGGVVRGWAFDPSAPDRRVEIRLFIDGIFAGMSVASRMRPDLLATGRGDGCYGFEIPADAFIARAGGDHVVVTVVAGSESQRLPSSASPQRSRRWSLKIPKRRRRPVDAREFVEVLAATPPFPKRAYVINPKIDGAMPDAFAADYVILALEYLRVDMVRTHAAKPQGLRQRLLRWIRLRQITGEIGRLTALAKATVASQELLKSSSKSLEVARSVPPR